MEFTRREFISHGAAGVGVFCFGPSLLGLAESAQAGSPDALKNDRILVILQLSGGNDGLSTVVPFGRDEYGRNRNRTRVEAGKILKLTNDIGLHPELKGLKALYDEGKLAVVQGTGYPDPNRSHFKSMDIWHAADHRGRAMSHGWVGRLVDTQFTDSENPNLVVHVGQRIPYALHAAIHRPVAFTAPQAYRWIGADREVAALEEAAPICEHEPAPARSMAANASAPRAHPGRDSALDRLRRVLQEAQESSQKVRDSVARFRPKVKYPPSPLSAHLATVAALITGGLGTRIYSVEMGGFDTHVNQKNRHDNLMRTLGGAVTAFQRDLEAHGLADRVCLMAFSEFGRRVRENGSAGTDHGVAGPMFVLGTKVKGGLAGKHPSLSRLDKGDLIHTTDFRRVYATLTDDWLGANHREVLGKRWPKLGLIGKRSV